MQFRVHPQLRSRSCGVSLLNRDRAGKLQRRAGRQPGRLRDQGLAIQDSHRALADALDIRGTPAFIVGDRVVPGAVDIDGLKKFVAEARSKG